MSGTVIAFVIIALAVGALLGWLFGSREGAGAKQTIESLRLQLNEVVKERDANREAVTKLVERVSRRDHGRKQSSQHNQHHQPCTHPTARQMAQT